jgi:hypothetical protein
MEEIDQPQGNLVNSKIPFACISRHPSRQFVTNPILIKAHQGHPRAVRDIRSVCDPFDISAVLDNLVKLKSTSRKAM